MTSSRKRKEKGRKKSFPTAGRSGRQTARPATVNSASEPGGAPQVSADSSVRKKIKMMEMKWKLLQEKYTHIRSLIKTDNQ